MNGLSYRPIRKLVNPPTNDQFGVFKFTLLPATLGISKYAANALGDVVFVELPELDSEVNSEDAISAVESVKSASDILTPVSGKVVEANSALESTPKLLNEDPEGEGWIAKIEITGEVEADTAKLMNAEAYQKFTEDADH